MMAEWTCQGMEITKEGDCYTTEDGNWEVSNVIGSAQADRGKNMTTFWEEHAWKGRGRRITLCKQPCGNRECSNQATEGGHVWLRRVGRNKLSAFCFIMPICGSCNREDENEDSFFPINTNVRLVARKKRKGME